MSGLWIAFRTANSLSLKASSPFFMSARRCVVRPVPVVVAMRAPVLVGDPSGHRSCDRYSAADCACLALTLILVLDLSLALFGVASVRQSRARRHKGGACDRGSATSPGSR